MAQKHAERAEHAESRYRTMRVSRARLFGVREVVAAQYDGWSVVNSGLRARLTCSGMAMRSPLMSVSTLLSSITEFIDSIHSVSTGASNKIHLSSGRSSAARTAKKMNQQKPVLGRGGNHQGS